MIADDTQPDAPADATPEPATFAPALATAESELELAPRRSRVALGVALWLAGMTGVAAFAMLPLPPDLLARQPRWPLWLLQLAGAVQSGLLLAALVALGTRLAPRVGLRAPAFEALVERRGVIRALAPQLVPGLVGALLGAGVLILFGRRAPAAIDGVVASGFAPTLAVRVLYGGITEELLLRWGVMTFLLWLFARRARRRGARPGAIAIGAAIVVSALLFGAGHLPTVLAFGGSLTREVVLYVLLGNFLFGSVMGALFARFGLESAMLAHALAHVIAFVV